MFKLFALYTYVRIFHVHDIAWKSEMFFYLFLISAVHSTYLILIPFRILIYQRLRI